MPAGMSISFDDDEPTFKIEEKIEEKPTLVIGENLEVALCDDQGKELTGRAPVGCDGGFKMPPATEYSTTSARHLVYYSTTDGQKVREVVLPARRMITPGDEFDQSILR